MTKPLNWPIALVAVLLAGCGVSLPGSIEKEPASASAKRPNVLVILADDLGYSDIGAFGSEIETPHLDRLAREGRVLTNMHVTTLCATTRASLLTGVDHHLVGVGTISENGAILYPGQAHYAGTLNGNAPTVAQLLRDAGYRTYMAGKWHLGGAPNGFGFDRSFSMTFGKGSGSNYVSSATQQEVQELQFYEDGIEAQVPEDFFSSDYYTDKLIEYIGEGGAQPFFGYLAFQAVHYPLQAPDAWLDRFSGRYDAGYAAIRDARIARQKDLGLIPRDFKVHPGAEVGMLRYGQPGMQTNTPWEQLTEDQRNSEARIMEVFAAMLANMDHNIGRVLDHLRSIGEYDNTFVVFLADNGADGIGVTVPLADAAAAAAANADNSLENYGRHGSYIYRSTRWAEVGSVPYRLFKGHAAEGGITSATIVRLPRQSGAVASGALSSLLDIVPTILDLTGTPRPGTEYQGRTIAPLEGISLLPVLSGKAAEVRADGDVLASEVNNIRFVRQGRWKMTRNVNYVIPSTGYLLTQDWQLYDMIDDRGETEDLAAEHPEVVASLKQHWRDYVTRVDVKQPAFPPTLIQIND